MIDKNFQELIDNSTPTLVDFYATWCGPCKMMTPILQELKGDLGDNIKIIKVNVDKYPELAAHFHVQGVPTLALFQNGNLQWKESGVRPAKLLKKVIDQYTKS